MSCKRDPITGRFVLGGALKTIEERFWEKVTKTDTCWLWSGSRVDFGYGQFFYRWISGKGSLPRRAHCVAWELSNGPIPKGMEVLHKCDNPPCVNPAHLFLGTQAENVYDMNKKGRHKRKLTPEAVEAVMENQITPRELTKCFGVHPRYYWTLRSIQRRRRKNVSSSSTAISL